MQAGVSLVSTFFLVLVPLARANLPPCLVASDLGSGQQTWHNVRSGAGAGLWALGTPLPRNLGVCPAGSGHRGQAVVHRTAPHDGLGTWAGWQQTSPCSWTTGGEQGLWLCPHGGRAGTYFCWHRLTAARLLDK